MGTNSNSSTQTESFEYRKLKNKEDMNSQLIAFALSIFLTVIAFLAIANDVIPATFSAPFILVLAVVQVIYQLYYFMHMKNKGHEIPSMFIWSGVIVAIITVAALMTLIWI
jgi:cytochrome c oxidase subunit 4